MSVDMKNMKECKYKSKMLFFENDVKYEEFIENINKIRLFTSYISTRINIITTNDIRKRELLKILKTLNGQISEEQKSIKIECKNIHYLICETMIDIIKYINMNLPEIYKIAPNRLVILKFVRVVYTKIYEYYETLNNIYNHPIIGIDNAVDCRIIIDFVNCIKEIEQTIVQLISSVDLSIEPQILNITDFINTLNNLLYKYNNLNPNK